MKSIKMSFLQLPFSTSRPLISSPFTILILLIISSLSILYLFISVALFNTYSHQYWPTSRYTSTATSIDHLVFGIASSANSWPKRKDYVQLWWKPQLMRGCVFLDDHVPSGKQNDTNSLPPVCISEDTSKFRYTYKKGLRSAIRVARIVSETVALNHSDVRWFVFGDDDTIFFSENLVKTLSKYDHNLWFYIGSNSESFDQNVWFTFEMAFGGGGFAISYPLAKVLAKVFDSCLVRYPHLYGSDGRISSCLAELGVGLTHESGFHQVDVRGDLFGMLAAHPLKPLVSLHHMDYVEPIFPNMTTNQALKHLFNAVKVDPERILQQTICYDRWFSWTISVSWGYAIQVIEGNKLLPELLHVQQTFIQWNKKIPSSYMFKTKELPNDPCKRPIIYYLENVSSDRYGIKSIYRKNISDNCLERKGLSMMLDQITVYSKKLDLDVRQLQAPRRHCCDVLPSSVGNVLKIDVRECKEEELIFMHR